METLPLYPSPASAAPPCPTPNLLLLGFGAGPMPVRTDSWPRHLDLQSLSLLLLPCRGQDSGMVRNGAQVQEQGLGVVAVAVSTPRD